MPSPTPTTELREQLASGAYEIDSASVAEAIVRRRAEFEADAHRSGVLVAAELHLLAGGPPQPGAPADPYFT